MCYPLKKFLTVSRAIYVVIERGNFAQDYSGDDQTAQYNQPLAHHGGRRWNEVF
jgi:hypothetical protein